MNKRKIAEAKLHHRLTKMHLTNIFTYIANEEEELRLNPHRGKKAAEKRMAESRKSIELARSVWPDAVAEVEASFSPL